jgi:hypothetical protein
MSGNEGGKVMFTLTDIEVGARLVEALIRHVRTAGVAPIAYADLLTLGRQLYPKDATLGREVPVGIGTKLAFVAAFCRESGYPDLSCLAVNPVTCLPRAGYAGDWDADRRAVAGHDWSGALERLLAFADAARAAVPRRFKPRKERPADVAWYAYFCSHREACAWIGADDKKEIINLLMAGLDPESAAGRVRAARAEFAEPS